MMFLCFLAEILPKTSFFSEYDQLSAGMILAGLVCLLLVCTGVGVGTGLVLYWLKKPVGLPELAGRLASRALPWPMISIFCGILISLYLLTSTSYSWIYPDDELGPHTLIFQTLAFHLPVFISIGLLFHYAGLRWSEVFGCHWKNAPVQLGLSLLFYLASVPLIWFCSALHQYLLHLAGYVSYPQEVAALLITSGPWLIRTILFFIAIIVAPIFEEIVFRGILLPFLVHRIGFWPGILSIALLFSGMHLHLPSLAPLFLLSLLLSLAYARTQSLWIPIGMHVLFNGFSILVLLITSS